MAGIVVLTDPSSPIEPGGEVTGSVRVRNTGDVVDSFTISVLGDAGAWTTVEPSTVALFPNAEQDVILRFRPPRDAGLAAGAVAVGVMVRSAEDSDWSEVVEGSLHIGGFSQITARVVPRTSEGKKEGQHRVLVENGGNTPVVVEIEASDPDEALLIELRPEELEVPPGGAARAQLRVRPRGRAGGPATPHPFQVKLTPVGGQSIPVLLDGTFMQKSGATAKVLKVVALVAAVGIVGALVLPALGGRTSSSASRRDLVQVAGNTSDAGNDDGASDADSEGDDEKDGDARSGAESGSSDDSTRGDDNGGGGSGDRVSGDDNDGAVNSAGDAGDDSTAREDSDGGLAGDGDGGGSGDDASTGDETTATSSAPSGGGSSTPTTSGSSPTSSPTTTAPTTTTTAAPAYKKFLGTWVKSDGSGATIVISENGKLLHVSESPAVCGNKAGCETDTSYSDPDTDGELDLAFPTGFGTTTKQTVRYVSSLRTGDSLSVTNSGGTAMTFVRSAPTRSL